MSLGLLITSPLAVLPAWVSLYARQFFSMSLIAYSSDMLQDTVVPLLSTQLCNSSCVYSGALTPRMLCAGYLDGRADACQVWPMVAGVRVGMEVGVGGQGACFDLDPCPGLSLSVV